MWGYGRETCRDAPGMPGPRYGECAREDEERRDEGARAGRARAEREPSAPAAVRHVVLVADTADQVREGMRARGLQEGHDFTLEDGRVVWSASHLRRRGWCCNHGCRNCPWRRQG